MPFVVKGIVSEEVEMAFVELLKWYKLASKVDSHTDSSLDKLKRQGIL